MATLSQNANSEKILEDYQAVEVKRCRFLFDTHLDLSCLPPLLRKYIKGPELVISRAKAEEAALELARLRVKTLSLQEKANHLPKAIKGEVQASPFRLYEIPIPADGSGDNWHYFSPVSRSLKTCKIKERLGKHKVFARENSLLAYKYGLATMLFRAGECELEEVKDKTNALVEAHGRSFPARELFQVCGDFVFLKHTNIWLPGPHYHYIYKELPLAQFGQILIYYKSDIELLKSAFGCLDIDLIEGSPTAEKNIEIVQFAGAVSDIFKGIYSEFLRSQEKTKKFFEVIQFCDWEAISDLSLREKLVHFANASYELNAMPMQFLDYLKARLPSAIDFKELRDNGLPPELLGIIIDASASAKKQYQGSNYYKIIFPEIEIMAGCKTTYPIIRDMSSAKWPASILLTQWRIMPYIGRARLTPRTEFLIARSKRAEIKEGLLTLAGIPTCEKMLVDEFKLCSFFLNMDQNLWRGHLELSRYFSGCGRLLQKDVREFDEPTSLFEDIFGNKFFICWDRETYTDPNLQKLFELSSERMWKTFFAQSCALKNMRLKENIPVFQLTPGTAVKDTGKEKVLASTVIALLKYYQYLTIKELEQKLASRIIGEPPLKEVIDKLLSEELILHSNEKFFYRYHFLNLLQMQSLIGRNFKIENKTHMQKWEYLAKIIIEQENFLPIIHPFRYGKNILEPIENILSSGEISLIENAARYERVICSERLVEYEADISAILEKYGIATLSSRGKKWNRIAKQLVIKVFKKYEKYLPQVQRRDYIRFHEGRNVLEIKYRILLKQKLILRLLSKKFTVKM